MINVVFACLGAGDHGMAFGLVGRYDWLFMTSGKILLDEPTREDFGYRDESS
jgi:hypothetical protein